MTSRNLRNLSIGTSSSKQHRKYLGDPNDPHHVPKSPLIERRKFSAQDEVELKQLCSLALAQIPHSDEMADDPFRYLGSHITAKVTTDLPISQPQQVQQNKVPESHVSSGDSTATPSDTSKRGTVQSDATTPLTTPGLTPGDLDRRFSDAGKPLQTSQSSTSRAEVKSAKGHAVYAFLKDPLPHTKPQLGATKSLTHLPTSSKSKSRPKGPNAPVNTSESMAINPDFNKSLPAIPKFPIKESEQATEAEPAPKERSNGITRMFKTVRLVRAQTAHEIPLRGTSSDQPQSLGQLNKFQSLKSPKKQKFSFSSLFHKRSASNHKRATVG